VSDCYDDLSLHLAAVKDMASNLERKWREKYVSSQDQAMNVDEEGQGRSCQFDRSNLGT